MRRVERRAVLSPAAAARKGRGDRHPRAGPDCKRAARAAARLRRAARAEALLCVCEEFEQSKRCEGGVAGARNTQHNRRRGAQGEEF